MAKPSAVDQLAGLAAHRTGELAACPTTNQPTPHPLRIGRKDARSESGRCAHCKRDEDRSQGLSGSQHVRLGVLVEETRGRVVVDE